MPVLVTGSSVDELAAAILSKDRRAVARAITLVESTRPDDRATAQELIRRLLPNTGGAFRIGISGVPGAGKSTFIETLGMSLAAEGPVAVLAVDPTSQISGGSILGDKTRMQRLGREPNAFIRPSPSGGALGGVTRRTRETILLCEAAGFETILVETVGVGQSEIEVASMTDLFLLVMLPNAGDELQGIKKGILELADCVVVNKLDLDKAGAMRTQADLTSALRYMRPRTHGWNIPVLLGSALDGTGIKEVRAAFSDFAGATGRRDPNGFFHVRRRQQNSNWFHSLLAEEALRIFNESPVVQAGLPDLERRVQEGSLTPVMAVEELARLFKAGATGR